MMQNLLKAITIKWREYKAIKFLEKRQKLLRRISLRSRLHKLNPFNWKHREHLICDKYSCVL